jgi:hypothetical protein
MPALEGNSDYLLRDETYMAECRAIFRDWEAAEARAARLRLLGSLLSLPLAAVKCAGQVAASGITTAASVARLSVTATVGAGLNCAGKGALVAQKALGVGVGATNMAVDATKTAIRVVEPAVKTVVHVVQTSVNLVSTAVVVTAYAACGWCLLGSFGAFLGANVVFESSFGLYSCICT